VKVLLATGLDISLPGGVETHVRELAAHLGARGHDVAVQGRWTRADAGQPPRIVREADVDLAPYDIVHHHGGPWPRRWDAGNRYLRTFHFSVAAKMGVYLRIGRLRTLLNPGNHRALAEERASLRRGRRAIAVSRSLREELVRFHGADRDAVTVVPNGASFAAPRAGRADWRRRHDIDARCRVLLTIGRDDYVKGLDLLERAWSMPGTRPDGSLWVQVGGRAPERRDDRLVTGPIAPEDVTEWIAAADVGAFPSYYEGGGIALVDMIAGGLYVLTHAVGVAPDVVRPGANGEFVPRRVDAWSAALGRTLAAPPSPSGAPLSDEWSWDAIAARVEAVYERQREERA